MMELLAVSLLKASLVLALAQLIVIAMRGLSAATKHLLLTIGMTSFLLIPLLARFAPAWQMTVVTEAAVTRGVSPPTPLPAERGEGGRRPGEGRDVAALLWTLGMLTVLARLVRAAIRLRRIVARAVPCSPRLVALLSESRVRLLQSDRIQVPMVWGIRSGTLLLPVAAEEWPDEQLRATFIHELGHLRRLDYVSLTLMNLVSALLWFHPQVWLARRRALVEGERACDDLVLRAGARASEYASHLLDVARRLPRREPLAAFLAMSRPSQLEGRMHAILSPSTNRQAIGGKRLMISIASFIAVVVPFAVFQVVAQPAVAAQPDVAAPPAAVVEPAPVAASEPADAPASIVEEATPAEEAIVAEPAVVAEPAAEEAAVAEEPIDPVEIMPADDLAVVQEPIAPVQLLELEKPRPFHVIGKVEGRTCTVRLARPTNTGDPSRNPAEALAIQRVQQKAAAKGADGVANLTCMREIRIGLSCPTAVVCTADAIVYDDRGE